MILDPTWSTPDEAPIWCPECGLPMEYWWEGDTWACRTCQRWHVAGWDLHELSYLLNPCWPAS